MPRKITKLVVFWFAVGAAGFAWGASPLKSTMRGWKPEAAAIDAMLVGSGAFDPAEAAQILGSFVADSQAVVARISAANAQAHDIKARFERFSHDAQSAVDAAGSRDKLKTAYSQLRADCRSCHDLYNN